MGPDSENYRVIRIVEREISSLKAKIKSIQIRPEHRERAKWTVPSGVTTLSIGKRWRSKKKRDSFLKSAFTIIIYMGKFVFFGGIL